MMKDRGNRGNSWGLLILIGVLAMAMGWLWAVMVAPAFAQTPGGSLALPRTFKDLLANLVTDALFLGGLASVLTGGLFKILEEYVPGNGYFLPERWARLVSLLMPFLLVAIALTAQEIRGEAMQPFEDAMLAAFNTGLAAVGGKSLVYTAWRIVKPSNADKAYPSKLHAAQVAHAVKNGKEPPPPASPGL